MVTRIQPVQSVQIRQSRKRILRRKGSIGLLLLLCIAVGYWEISWNHKEEQAMSDTTMIRVYDTETQTLLELPLEEYITGVVAAEMPASFALEALKAQAVAARTYAVNRMQHPNDKVTALHPQAQITTSPELCQAWISEEVQRMRWGTQYETWHKKIEQAVTETAGEVLYYDNELIEPVYHASCGGGFTESAENVWGTAKPYLISVACNHPADKHSNETTTMTLAQFAEKLNLQGAVAASAMYGANGKNNNQKEQSLTITTRTEANRVKEVKIGDELVRGGRLRSALGLKSTLMDWEIAGDTITFTTNGYGHGVGMCQYGADYYAEQGYHYQQILQHYYPGTKLGVLP